jgi:hypothetical protein
MDEKMSSFRAQKPCKFSEFIKDDIFTPLINA